MIEKIKQILKSEIEEADKIDDRFAEMEENDEFMDGEMNYSAGKAKGRLSGLNMALAIIEEVEKGA